MQLGLAFDQRAWQLAQKADCAALQKLVAGLEQGQGDIQQDTKLIIQLLQTQGLNGGGGDTASTGSDPREQWQLDPKFYKFDKIFDEEEDVYVRAEPIGSGSFGTVYRGMFLGRDPVAIKSVNFTTDKELAAFRAEVTLLFRLSHPNITTLFGASIKGKKGNMVLELFPRSLSDVIHDSGGQPISLPQMASIAVQIAAAMAYLHASSPKVIHRDLKPDNVMVTLKGKAKIIDFGLAATKNSSASSATKLGTAGTLPYQAPELLSGTFTGTHKIDNYAYAVTINEMFAGKPPFEGMSGRQLEHAIVKGSRPVVPASMPERIKVIVGSCLNPNPRARPEFSAIHYALENPQASFEAAAAAAGACLYSGPRGICTRRSIEESKYCDLHACPTPECVNPKSSRQPDCGSGCTSAPAEQVRRAAEAMAAERVRAAEAAAAESKRAKEAAELQAAQQRKELEASRAAAAEQERQVAVMKRAAATEEQQNAKAAREKAVREKAARNKAARDKATSEKAAREKLARDKAAREKTARDKAAREKVVQEKAARKKAASDKPPTGRLAIHPYLGCVSVFRVDNCEKADWNGHYRDNGTHNDKAQYCHVNGA